MESYFEFNEKSTHWEVLDFAATPDIEVTETELTEEEIELFRLRLDRGIHE